MLEFGGFALLTIFGEISVFGGEGDLLVLLGFCGFFITK